MRRLIINADDFGLTEGVNRGIVESHLSGVVTSTTLMACGDEWEDAVRRAQSAPRLDVGCHVVLVDGKSMLPADKIPSLAESVPGAEARFRRRWSRMAMAALTGRLNPAEIEVEAAAQIRRLQSVGLAVSHVDTHKHLHVFPRILRPLLRAAKACGVRAVRNPFGRVLWAGKPLLWKRRMAAQCLNSFVPAFRAAVAAEGLLAPDGSVGIVATGALEEGVFASILENLPQGTWELVCHPGYPDEQLSRTRTRLRESRLRELKLLTSSHAVELLAQHSVELVSYAALCQG